MGLFLGGKTHDNSTETISECIQIFYLADKDFKAGIINKFKDVQKTMLKELKESMTTINEQIDILKNETNYKKRKDTFKSKI